MNRLEQNTIVSEDAAKSILNPHLDSFLTIIKEAWGSWEELGEKAPELRAPLSARCRASFIYDHIAYRARSRFDGIQGVRLEERRGFLLLHIDNKVTIRFKKLDAKNRTRNVPTQQQIRFSLQLEMEGLPKSTRLVAGYKLNDVQTAIQQIAVTCPVGNNLQWFFEIPDADAPSNIEFLTPPPPAPVPATVVAKNVKVSKKQESAGE
jgi:hypothetical protein